MAHGEDDDDSRNPVKIGKRKERAVKTILKHSTQKSYAMLVEHKKFIGDSKNLAFSDQLLSLLWIWPGSDAPPENKPEDSWRLAKDIANVALREVSPTTGPPTTLKLSRT